MLINELEDLEDIMDTLVFEDPPSIFNEDYALELIETALHLMDEFMMDNPTAITEPDFHDTLLDEIKDIFYIQMEDAILSDDYIEDDMNDLLEEAFNIYITTFHTERSLEQQHHFLDISNKDMDVIENKINMLKEIPQPVQRTPEWYQFRWNLITASNAYKVFESQSSINQLIYEKCQPLKTVNVNDEEDDVKMVNTNSPLHWGQKYEPLSVLLYEKMYQTKVGDFGCIPHKTYRFLGASPDGINIDKNADRYGRMLEIKNVVSREITGIPKKEYWVQMQLQMEVCDLDECDFLETKFIEYTDYESYKNDIIVAEDKMKGIIIHFYSKDGKPFYVYKPLDIVSEEEVSKWEEDTLNMYQEEPYNYTYLRFIYWKLERLSCVLVLRNKEWFKNNIPQLEKVWKIIEEERITGYEHRAPIKKAKKEFSAKPFIDFNSSQNNNQGCLLKFNKIIKIDTEPIKIDTESILESKIQEN
jgi:putative phage-type endonuclease